MPNLTYYIVVVILIKFIESTLTSLESDDGYNFSDS